ncbi:MAG: hypothetical protein QNJ11_17735 [Woeseiaceae bacterium]|nr:hypothetical protein [Woeseiaceae bacterium]
MADHVDRFHAALTVLAGHGHVKQRLIKAWEENLSDVHEDELPIALKQSFADLRHDMNRVTPANGESPICASVRKMSLDEASTCAAHVVTLYGALAGRASNDIQVALPLSDNDDIRVPPFLVKSI